MNSKSKVLTLVFIGVSIGAHAQYDCEGTYEILVNSPASVECGSMCGDSDCCVDDTTKCGGMSSPPGCGADEYFVGSATHGGTDANCCAAKTACSASDCPTGMTLKTGDPTKGAAEGASSDCCDLNSDTCAATWMADSSFCGTGKYLAAANFGTTAGDTADDKIANCCTDVPSCASAVCDTTFFDPTPLSGNQVCASSGCSDDSCCSLRDDICHTLIAGGLLTASDCEGDHIPLSVSYYDVATDLTTEQKATACCGTPPTCADAPVVGSTNGAPQSMPGAMFALATIVAAAVSLL